MCVGARFCFFFWPFCGFLTNNPFFFENVCLLFKELVPHFYHSKPSSSPPSLFSFSLLFPPSKKKKTLSRNLSFFLFFSPPAPQLPFPVDAPHQFCGVSPSIIIMESSECLFCFLFFFFFFFCYSWVVGEGILGLGFLCFLMNGFFGEP